MSKHESYAEKVGRGLVEQLLKAVDEGIGPVQGARDYAEGRRRTMGSRSRAIRRIINETTAASASLGFTTGLGGLVTLPISLPANITGQAVLNARMVAAIAYLRGYELSDESVRAAILVTVAGGSPNAVLSRFGVTIGQKLTESAIKRLSIDTIRAINRKVGFMLFAKYGTKRAAVTLIKAVPLAGGVVGGAVDATFTRTVAAIARKSFPWLPASAGQDVSPEDPDDDWTDGAVALPA